MNRIQNISMMRMPIMYINGGNFGSGFVAGAVSSCFGSPSQHFSKNPYVIPLYSAAAGGITAWATGGNFLQGALQGFKIGLFNHIMHYDSNAVYTDENGNYTVFLKEFEFVYERPNLFSILLANSDKALDPIGFGFTALESVGKSLDKKSQNSTVGSNGKFYFHTSDQRGFYGNQYVKTVKLTNVGSVLGKVLKPVGILYDCKNLAHAYSLDVENASIYGKNNYYNTVKTAGGISASWAGATLGFKAGSFIGSFYGGVGAIPVGIIGGIIGGIAGSISFGLFGESVVDYLYMK